MVFVQAKTLAPGYNREMIRGVNIGSWLVLEKWMCPSLFDTYASSAVDEWTFTETLGKDAAYTALQSHWSSWFTKDDVVSLKGMGINALRIPVGYWSFDLQDGEPYVWGAQDWLDTAIEWAREEGLYVWVDLHGVPGSQNGFDNSGRSGPMDWQTVDGNIARTHSVLKTIAKKYGASSYADVVIGIQLVNEPASWGNNSNDITRDFYNDGYGNVWAEIENGNMMVVIHDNFLPLSDWTNFQGPPAAGNLGIDTHIYQVFAESDNTLNQDGHVALACSKGDLLAAANAIVPVFTGEWSGSTNICLLADGSTIAGTSCSEDGCQCESADSRTWSAGLIAQLRRFNEAQMDVWEETTSGYFFWNFKTEHAPAWDFMKGAQNGWIPQPLSDRQFPGQCGY
ncbi:glycoside hydrolase, partial [Saitoella complicata NRRL Y-17804]|uniref:glycoside hydrolase n=1 Tax=Saitoella complicata (strain BCRC 22490 / CBS 7301 / JCM 7358 / NBRC 10748 / NRRL Y-17804) TaxID=698492 RepID=UPI00086790C3